MPIPKPKDNEKRKDFIKRFMSNKQMVKEYPNDKQRLAIANSTYDKQNKKGYNVDIELKKYENIDFKPTKSMANNAKRGLAMREKQPPSNRGGTAVGLARARQLINRETLSPSTVKRMYSFFSRHEVDKQSESWKKGNSKGEQAWLLWGGDSGFAWSKSKVNQMKREDEKKGGELLSIETKGISLEIKSIDEKGVFKGIASPYNNIDLGNDRVLPSIAKRNNGKTIHYLWQHDPKNTIGKVTLKAGKDSMEFEGELFLDKDGETPMIPDAFKAYALMKKGMLKNSIGYRTLDRKYTRVKGKGTVRDLIDIDIKELSAVTFPMNPKAKINQVKEEGDSNMEDERIDELEEKFETLNSSVDKLAKILTKSIAMNNPELDEEFKSAKDYISGLSKESVQYKQLSELFGIKAKEDEKEEDEEEKEKDKDKKKKKEKEKEGKKEEDNELEIKTADDLFENLNSLISPEDKEKGDDK